MKLPYTDGSAEIGDYEDPLNNLSRMSNPLSSSSVKMTKAAIAGIDIKRLNSFMPGKLHLSSCLSLLYRQDFYYNVYIDRCDCCWTLGNNVKCISKLKKIDLSSSSIL